MAKKTGTNLIKVVEQLHEILAPLDEADRARVVRSVFALLGDSTPPPGPGGQPLSPGTVVEGGEGLPAQAARWMKQNGVTRAQLDEVFHIEGDTVEIIASTLPGASKRARTVEAYLVCGIRSLLSSGSADISESDAVKFATHAAAWDKANHAANRKGLGNRTTGNKDSGFKLAGPGLREAATVIKAIAGDVQ